MEIKINDKKLAFTPVVMLADDGDDLIIAADLGENKDIWKSTFFPDIPEKELYKQQKVLDQIYAQLEEKLTQYTKENYGYIDVDWDTVRYEELFLMDNNFSMAVMLND